jgi:hypothetical protein
MKRVLSLFGVALLLSVAIPAVAAPITVYDNGPINGNINAWTISAGFLVSDSFTLLAATDVESVHFGVWVFPGDIPDVVDFGISASPFGTDLAFGTGTLSNVFQFSNGFGADVYQSSFTFTSVDLAAGAYYITLGNGFTTNGDPLFWDENDGPSLAFENTVGPIGSESFQIDGTPLGTTPEPGTLIMLGTSILGIAGSIRRRSF